MSEAQAIIHQMISPLRRILLNRQLQHKILSIVIVLGLLLPNSSWGASSVTAWTGNGSPLGAGGFAWPEIAQTGDASGFLYRTRVRLANPSSRARLDQMGVGVLSEGADADGAQWAIVLADETQLEDLARLRFEPDETEELVSLMDGNSKDQPQLAISLWPLISRASEVRRLRQLGASAAQNAITEVHLIMEALTGDQKTAIASFSSAGRTKATEPSVPSPQLLTLENVQVGAPRSLPVLKMKSLNLLPRSPMPRRR